VIISESAAKVLFPGEEPIGKQLRPAATGDNWFAIIGIVETCWSMTCPDGGQLHGQVDGHVQDAAIRWY
jgi:hypothetical protein